MSNCPRWTEMGSGGDLLSQTSTVRPVNDRPLPFHRHCTNCHLAAFALIFLQPVPLPHRSSSSPMEQALRLRIIHSRLCDLSTHSYCADNIVGVAEARLVGSDVRSRCSSFYQQGPTRFRHIDSNALLRANPLRTYTIRSSTADQTLPE
ncbi:unnamed protein product [Cyclocybe aegerita]|uniref:Uncharacterized protein n=1 Tax=Cyclocybe aegerita TaxID=1973307 RepID=A0A8S0W4L9_CYCAE|nr:unnamed protein product [Cyclocybe aegerita]